MYVGLENYIRGIKQTRLIQAFGWSLFITILSVAVIILCCSMCAWYITRVHTKVTKTIYVLCLFSMIVIVLVVGLLCYNHAGKQAQNMAGAVLVMEE